MRDLGMLACIAALKEEYLNVMAAASTDHNALPAIERESLGFDHTQVGAQLAGRWRLPDQLTQSISYHHKPDLAAPEHMQLVYCVALGGHIAGALSAAEPKPYLALVASKGDNWLKLSRDVTKQLLADTAKQAKELATVLDVNTGPSVNIESLMAEAQEALVLGNAELERQASELQTRNDMLAKQTVTDSLTKAFNRSHFDTTIAQCYSDCKEHGAPFSLLFFDADKFKSINDTLGHQAGDAVLRELAKRSSETVAEQGGIVCRYGGEEFGILLPGVPLSEGEKLAERLRAAMDAKVFDLGNWGLPGTTPRVTISVGVSGVDAQTIAQAAKPEDVTHAADQGVYSAKATGRNRVCACPVGGEPRLVSKGQGFTLQAKGTVVEATPAGQVVAPVEGAAQGQVPAQAVPALAKPATKPLAKPETKAESKQEPKPVANAPAPVPSVGATVAAAQPVVSRASSSQSSSGQFSASQSVSASPSRATQSPAGSAGTLVLVEDDPLAAKLVELLFQKRSGYALRVFDSAEAMLAWSVSADYVRPTIVLCDWQLPGLSGINLLSVMRSHPKLGKVAVALLSSRVDSVLIDNAREAGCNLVLSKADLCSSFDACLSQIQSLAQRPVPVLAA
jgi:diguanylate cyclase (GGDEF)-like protein